MTAGAASRWGVRSAAAARPASACSAGVSLLGQVALHGQGGVALDQAGVGGQLVLAGGGHGQPVGQGQVEALVGDGVGQLVGQDDLGVGVEAAAGADVEAALGRPVARQVEAEHALGLDAVDQGGQVGALGQLGPAAPWPGPGGAAAPRRSPRPGPAAAAWPACGRLDGHRHPPLEAQVAQVAHVALHGQDRRAGDGRRGPGRGGGAGRCPGRRRGPVEPPAPTPAAVPAGGEHQPGDGQRDHQQQDQRRRQPPTRRPRGGSGGGVGPHPAPPPGSRRPLRLRQPGRSVLPLGVGGRGLPARAAGRRWAHDAGSPARDSTSSWVRRRNERRGRSRSSTHLETGVARLAGRGGLGQDPHGQPGPRPAPCPRRSRAAARR